jgi:hypothetical protein
MAITVVGSVAYDSIETPAGGRTAAWAARQLIFRWPQVSLPMCASSPWWARTLAPSRKPSSRPATSIPRGIERAAGKSFFWEGSYLENLNEAKTHNTELNVFASFNPKIPDAYRDSEFLFLANIDPVLQRRVREQMPDVKLVAGDTMNYWIKDHRPRCSKC